MSILSEEKKEGLRNGACDDYFEARPQIDSLDRRRVFEAGFDRACKAIEAAVLEHFAQGVKVQIPSPTFEQEMQNQRRIGYEQGKKAVFEALEKQEPVAEVIGAETPNTVRWMPGIDRAKREMLIGAKLYAAPIIANANVQPETKSAGYWRKCHDIAEATNVALRKQIVELIAAAEGKK